jgi:hypothetical protein
MEKYVDQKLFNLIQQLFDQLEKPTSLGDQLEKPTSLGDQLEASPKYKEYSGRILWPTPYTDCCRIQQGLLIVIENNMIDHFWSPWGEIKILGSGFNTELIKASKIILDLIKIGKCYPQKGYDLYEVTEICGVKLEPFINGDGNIDLYKDKELIYEAWKQMNLEYIKNKL